jgi:hypothetical protein
VRAKRYERYLHSHQEIRERRNMNIRWKSARAFLFIPLALLLSMLGSGVAHAASMNGNMNGAAGQMPAFYDGTQFTINLKQMPANAAAALIAHNGSINMIFVSNDLDTTQEFIPVINAIQGDGFNPLWQQVLITFNPGFTPHQFVRDDDVLAATKAVPPATTPEITLVPTDEVYRCAVVGPGPKRKSIG